MVVFAKIGSFLVKLINKHVNFKKLVCQLFFDLRDFKSEKIERKEYYKPLIGEEPTPELKCTIGIKGNKNTEEVSKIGLGNDNGIFVTPESFTPCEILYEELIKIFLIIGIILDTLNRSFLIKIKN